MAPFPKIHDLYVSRMVVMTVLLTWTVLVGLDVVNAMIGEFGDVGKGNYGLLDAVTYIVYTIPRRAYTMFPTVAVIGALMALGQLAASSELTALRALGLRSEEHTSELQSLMRNSYAVLCSKKKQK